MVNGIQVPMQTLVENTHNLYSSIDLAQLNKFESDGLFEIHQVYWILSDMYQQKLSSVTVDLKAFKNEYKEFKQSRRSIHDYTKSKNPFLPYRNPNTPTGTGRYVFKTVDLKAKSKSPVPAKPRERFQVPTKATVAKEKGKQKGPKNGNTF
jgi:hypothetical protein